ncbi:MAG: cytochrome C oxidase subunit IV family protein [Methylobacteriaceae bacterium]|nr:cytochrome C oxidase subunit IV family protein [Methylobacteriaceae bacterium]MBV9246297.1 cytochrome C oxidase subunit IV family protein [Methylobacteriaceae bacterium]MBV9635187.1 cytochrome C oxidase subunit IV family protein [Methylobacteriaceae bacterium]MBV9701277.1 cytochrome C oxidase subunit IV family protein [Methylobacteriaceae bacterium]
MRALFRKSALLPEVAAWVGLLVLMVVSLVSSYVPLGLGNGIANLAIAGVQMLVVVFVLMHLKEGGALPRLAAAAGAFWLAIFFTLTFSDFLTR